jgi:DNA-binding MarR family transcriptional regulator
MILSDKLLKSKDLTPTQKFVLGLILSENLVVMQFGGGYLKTCSEIGKEIGLSRAKVKTALSDLVKQGYVITEYGTAWRKTNLTDKGSEYAPI